VIRAEYEQHQLRLIAAEYESKGFSIVLEVPVPGTNFTFDAVATRPDGGVTIIELVNARHELRNTETRVDVLRRAALLYPGASVDLRYIDSGQSAFSVQMERLPNVQGGADNQVDRLNKVLKVRLPKQPGGSDVALTRSFLDLWALHVATIRSFRNLRIRRNRSHA